MGSLLNSKLTWFAAGVLLATFVTVVPSTIKSVV